MMLTTPIMAQHRALQKSALITLNPNARKFSAYHEAGQRWSPNRSTLPGAPTPQDARYDDPPQERAEVLKKSRYFERNNGIVNRLADVWEQYTVGANGMPIVPKSSDPKWNAAAKRKFAQFAKRCDLVSTQSWSSFQSQVSRRWFIDGECFILKTATSGPRPQLRVQLIESHRVRTPDHLYDQEGKTIWDGIEYDVDGLPSGYWVEVNGAWYLKKAANIVHVGEPSRPGTRAFSFLSPVLNVIHDLDDLQLLEMQAAKAASIITNVFSSESGEQSAEGLRRERFKLPTQDTQGAESIEDRVALYNKNLAGKTIALKLNEKMEQFRSERPCVAMREYWDYLTSLVCIGTGLTKQLVFPWSIQGTVVRADFDIQNTFFRTRSGVLASAFVEIWTWVIGWESNWDPSLADKPGDWQEVAVVPPRAVNVDVGRNSQAMIAELDAGLTTYEDIFLALGKDAETQIRTRAREEAMIDRIAKEEGTTPDRIRSSISKLLGSKPAAPGENGAPDPSGAPTPAGDPAAPALADFRTQADAYGIAVRAGAITPIVDDEEHFRRLAGLPGLSAEAKRGWNEEPTRRPITLAQPGDLAPAAPALSTDE